MSSIPVGSNINLGSKKIIGLRDVLQWYQTFTLHAIGVGQQDMGILVPYDCYIEKFRYRIAAAGSGGSLTCELRKNGITGGDTIASSSATPSTSPSWTTPTAPGFSLAEDDLLWAYVTAINSTTVGAQLKCEAVLVRR